MGIFDKVKGAFGIDDEEFDDDEMMDELDEEEVAVPENTYKADFTQNVVSTPAPVSVKKEKNVSLSSLPQLQVVLVKPERFEEASDIADSLNAKKTVVLNLESASKEVARRLVDFLSGVAYANQGNVQKIANSTFLITPYNVDISGIGLLDDIDTQGALY
ncbi:MAG: cell division protein SepF [Oscillospiraceae bacterium]|nr:cell division protein SepF [Oscillospiraceae bacterium]MBQ6850270.1 cell division protein SepF [Oscillospiraceae bacterium]MBR6647661.1 cell division protein SepF [Clostridia bacterium]